MQLTAWMNARKAKKEQEHVRALIGIKELTENGVVRNPHEEELILFLLEPDNLSVLSEESLKRKVYGLMTVLKGFADLEFCCVNSRENFTQNKRYLKRRIREESNPSVRGLLEADLKELLNMEHAHSGAREFLIILRLRKDNAREIAVVLSRVEKAFREQAIRVRRAEKDDVKRILSVYFAQRMESGVIEDFDGKRWVMDDEEDEA